MSIVNLRFSGTLSPCDPSQHPVLVVGQLKNLNKVTFDQVKVKLEHRVTEEVNIACSD